MLHKDPVEVNPHAGQLLIAEPMMSDGIFSRSVIILLDRSEDHEYMGLCLNKGPVCRLSDIYGEIEGSDRFAVYQGGPVGLDRLFLLHRVPDLLPRSVEVTEGLYLGAASEENVRRILDVEGMDEGKFRFVIGYSGWASEQLTSEIMQSSWAFNQHPRIDELLIGEGENYWKREVTRLGEDYKSWLLFPTNPSMN